MNGSDDIVATSTNINRKSTAECEANLCASIIRAVLPFPTKCKHWNRLTCLFLYLKMKLPLQFRNGIFIEIPYAHQYNIWIVCIAATSSFRFVAGISASWLVQMVRGGASSLKCLFRCKTEMRCTLLLYQLDAAWQQCSSIGRQSFVCIYICGK